MAADDQRWLDDALLAAQAGQAWALRAIYDELAPRVHGYVRARGGSEPEDLTSEVFLTVFSKLDSVSGGSDGLRALVFSVAHARLVDDLRRQARQAISVSYESWHDERSTTSTEEVALDRIRTAEVRALLGQLPPEQRDVLLMRLVGDLSLEQVARAIGRSTGAVKQLQRRALLTLRAHIRHGELPLTLAPVTP